MKIRYFIKLFFLIIILKINNFKKILFLNYFIKTLLFKKKISNKKVLTLSKDKV